MARRHAAQGRDGGGEARAQGGREGGPPRGASDQEGDQDDDRQGESERFNAHWGWFATIHHLSETAILKITGDKSITDLNFVFVLNYLAYEKDKNGVIERAQRRQTQTYKIR